MDERTAISDREASGVEAPLDADFASRRAALGKARVWLAAVTAAAAAVIVAVVSASVIHAG